MGSISNYIGTISRPSSSGSITDPLGGSISTAGSVMLQLFGQGQAGFLGDPLVTGQSLGGAIAEITNQANASPDLTQSTAASKPTLGRYPYGGIRNQFTTDTATFTTRNFTTRAAEYTLQMKGTGSITLTGTSTAGPLVGTGASDIVSLAFTPTAGTLTLTVAGSVTDAQIEFGSAATAYQYVAAAYDITETGQASVEMDYYDGGDFLTFGVQEIGGISLSCEAGEPFLILGVRRGLVANGVFIAQASGAAGTFTFASSANAGGNLAINARGTVNDTGLGIIDGQFHAIAMWWDGAALQAVVDQSAPFVCTVGAAAQQAENITFGARTESAAANQFVGFEHLEVFRVGAAASLSEVRSAIAAMKLKYGTV